VARHGVDIAFAHVSSALESAAPMTLELPADLPRGLYLVELALSGSQGEFLPGTGEGRGMGTLYIGAVRVPKGPPLSADATTLAEFEDLRLLRVEMDQPRATELQLRMHWSTLGTPRNWSLSLRVLDLEGRLIVQQDLQPGYGYLPTTLWRPDERIVDTLIVPLPEGLAPGDYTLRVVTYLEATMHSGGEADIPVHIATPTLWDLRDACCEQTRKGATILCQTDEIALLSLDAAASIQEGEDLDFAAEWNALRTPTEDVQATWTLVNTNGDMVTALDAPLAVGSRTSEWPRHSWVLSPQRLDLPQRLDEGPLELYLTLEASDAEATACGRVATIGVLSRPRVFSTPTPAHTQHATFGDDIVLLGYDLERHTTRTSHESSLSLTLWWQASQAPLQDLKRFVHLYVKETEAIVAQDDAMPRGWTYPTTLWVAGEVISETVTLDLSGIPPGTYNVGVGWYDPSNSTRLAVTAADPAAVKSDRLTLDAIVAVER
ncbi:MAG: hypothetical protein JXC32_13335, partial [Anaerolineae bacterium]|nr:hypothetical protein [Anaerolineae bacterium]